MSRITIFQCPPGLGGPGRRVGWFQTETAEYWEAPDSTNRVWRTPAGRWVWTAGKLVEYLTDDEARENLTRWGYGDDARRLIDNARGPGRPEIGPEVKTRLPQAVVDTLDAMAAANGITRAEQMRQLITDGVYAP